jgi:hypothetical protein
VTDSHLSAAIDALYGPFVELDPELARYQSTSSIGLSIRHPLVYSVMHAPMLNRIVNVALAEKKRRLAEAEEAEDWHTYVFLHERPYRAQALAAIADRATDAYYWELLTRVWMDSENIPEEADLWAELLADERPGREHMMDDDERAALAALPDVVTVYQGHTTERDDGWSWTTRLATAAWFADRFADMEDDEAVVTTGTVRREHITAYLLGRNEYEVLVDPSFVSIR